MLGRRSRNTWYRRLSVTYWRMYRRERTDTNSRSFLGRQKPFIQYGILTLLAVFALMQLSAVDRSTPAVAADIPTSLEVEALLQHACDHCHSNKTQRPWDSRIAPVHGE